MSEDELEKWQEIKDKEEENGIKIGNTIIRKNLFLEYPKAARHYLSLFPNNYLDIKVLQNIERLTSLNKSFLKKINSDSVIENQLLNFINNNNAYHIIASILKAEFNFGHHEAYIFPEFMLGNTYRADYLLVGKNSGGYEFTFIELESPKGNITLKSGEKGEVIRKGIKQVRDWNIWLESNYSNLIETFKRYKHPKKALPESFYKLDKSRIHYVVVAGRREDFKERTYRIKRDLKSSSKITLLHYDNLYDNANKIVGENTY
ncbi:Shedu anti-phage system protein SduA domain-containing protein [Halanaerobacter jeridensis]|uniref:DsRNA-specific ribonuclease n=1 Tax=Halanaerobacter jeridensis TaxID=706427 RepID=A0A938XQH5_9FIRM|nr:Shedu anti-phage system protein SduA domain-containing protein [Halanaerobacter jeridensis]MBM7557998.1 dsRNA-specific ribonuclease [Halanaerobacter jeridensis]